MAKEKKSTKTSKKTTKYTFDENKKIIKVEEDRKDPKGDAKKYRIGSICLWLLALAMEVVAILGLFDKIPTLGMDKVVFLILFIVLDLVFFIPGSLLWKKANHIDPMSEKNKTKFFLWNNLGTILSVLAFLPIIILVFTNKDLDGKQKGLVGTIAIIALLLAGLTSYDWNPVSAEQLAKAEKEADAVAVDRDKDGNAIVYWAPISGKKYHVKKDCGALKNAKKVTAGSVAKAYEKNLTDPCRRCIPEIKDTEDDHDHEEE